MATLPKHLDPNVSRIKFQREIDQFKLIQDDYIKRGIWLLKESYPIAIVAFAKALQPPAVPFAARVDFSDYDLKPLSVTLIDPFTQSDLSATEVRVPFLRQVPNGPGQFQQQPLVQAHSDNKPFICLPGIREYHEHPAHTGDSWLLHRGFGEGTFHFVIDTLYRYGIDGILNYNFGLNITLNNFQVRPVE